jgi:hypothetical protein
MRKLHSVEMDLLCIPNLHFFLTCATRTIKGKMMISYSLATMAIVIVIVIVIVIFIVKSHQYYFSLRSRSRFFHIANVLHRSVAWA